MNTCHVVVSCAVLAIAPIASADFVGVTHTSHPGLSDPDLIVYRLYAVFDDPDDDLAFVHGSTETPMSIEATSGSFFHAAAGDDGPSPESVWNSSLAVQDDSFVTIGSLFIPTGANDFLALPGWAPVSITFNTGGLIWGDNDHGVWVASDVDHPWGTSGSWGRAGNYPGNAVLFAQFTVASGGIEANNVTFAYLDSDGSAGSGGGESTEGGPAIIHVTHSFNIATCPADVSGDEMVDVTDLLELLAAWGPNAGHPADIDGNGTVDVTDLLTLLADWGPC